MTANVYRPEEYWTSVLRDRPSLSSVAYPDLAESFNAALYRAMTRAVRAALASTGREDLVGRTACDIGVGSGVWIDLWHGLGAMRVAGVDLTEAAVEHVRKQHPEAEVRRADIADGVPFDETFDLVSAMSVLLHIKDDERFRQAVRNIATLTAPEGHVLIMDPVVTRGWWGAPFDERANSKARELAEWQEAFDGAGLELLELIPVTALLANPADTRHRRTFRALEYYWVGVSALVGKRERLGAAVGAILTPLDRLALRLLESGPSTKVLVARRNPGAGQSK